MGRLAALLGRLEAILRRLGALLDDLGPSWSALWPSWTSLEPLLDRLGGVRGRLEPLSGRLGALWGVLEAHGSRPGEGTACYARFSALRLPPDNPPRGPPPNPELHSLVPSSFRHLGRHGNGKSASETCPRKLTPLCVIATLAFKAHYVIVRTGSLGVQSFFASPFALESSGVERFLTSPSVLGSLAVKSWLLDVKLHSFKRLRKLDDLGLFVPSWGSLGLS